MRVVLIAVIDDAEKAGVDLGASAVHVEMSCGDSADDVGVAIVDLAARHNLAALWELYKEKWSSLAAGSSSALGATA